MKNPFRSIIVAAMLCIAAIQVYAAALSAAVNTPYRPGAASGYLQASNVVYGGAIAAIDTSTGKIVPATDSTGLQVVGCVASTSDNGGLLAANYSATRKVVANRGIFRWDNGDSFTAADVGSMCYIEDDHTVQKVGSATYDIPVGIIVEVDSDGVWVDTLSIARAASGSFTTIAASGNATLGAAVTITGAATVGGTLGVTGALTARLPVLTTVLESGTTRTCTSADYGKIVIVTNGAAVAITLPANGAAAGSYIDFMNAGTDDCAPTVSAATNDTLIGPNDVDLDSVTYGTGHRIGSYLRVISDGTYWHAINLGTTTMTGND